MKLVDFDFSHIALFDWREDEYEMYNVRSDFVRAILGVETKGQCFTVLHDGRIMAIGGVINQSQKTGYVFTMLSKHVEKNPIGTARLCKRSIARTMKDMGFHRLVTYNLLSATRHHKWCEWLGFKREAVVEKFDDDGNDYVQYSMVTHGP